MSLSSVSRSSSGSAASFLNYDELIKTNLQRGDLIEIDRGTYNHWAFYAGQCDNETHWCFHVTTTGDGDFEKKDALMSNNLKAVAAIKKHKLKDILEDTASKKPSMVRVNNKIQEARNKNCVPLPIDQVIEDLEKRKDKPIDYCLMQSNCEHNVTSWKYGAGWSDQVETVATARDATILVGLFAGVVSVVTLIVGIFKGPSSSNKKINVYKT